jgi:hypothetical protein
LRCVFPGLWGVCDHAEILANGIWSKSLVGFCGAYAPFVCFRSYFSAEFRVCGFGV